MADPRGRRSAALELGRAEREADDLREAVRAAAAARSRRLRASRAHRLARRRRRGRPRCARGAPRVRAARVAVAAVGGHRRVVVGAVGRGRRQRARAASSGFSPREQHLRACPATPRRRAARRPRRPPAARAARRAASPRAASRSSRTPGSRFAATARPKLMRLRIAPVFIHASPVSGQPFGRLVPEDRLPEARDELRRARRRVGRARRSRAAALDHELERRLHLRAVRGAREELGRRDDRAHASRGCRRRCA